MGNFYSFIFKFTDPFLSPSFLKFYFLTPNGSLYFVSLLELRFHLKCVRNCLTHFYNGRFWTLVRESQHLCHFSVDCLFSFKTRFSWSLAWVIFNSNMYISGMTLWKPWIFLNIVAWHVSWWGSKGATSLLPGVGRSSVPYDICWHPRGKRLLVTAGWEWVPSPASRLLATPRLGGTRVPHLSPSGGLHWYELKVPAPYLAFSDITPAGISG